MTQGRPTYATRRDANQAEIKQVIVAQDVRDVLSWFLRVES